MEPASAAPVGLPRWFDILVAALGLVCAGPLLLLLGALVRATSPGPVLFRQTRVGLGGRPFTLLKLRSMSASAAGSPVTAAGDRRVTPIGRTLRSLKLDELPQLWNVLVGDMSLVGPRPEVPELVDYSDAAWRRILSVRPGLTDPVTVRLRNEEDLLASARKSGVEPMEFYRMHLLPWKMRGYLAFVDGRSVRGDLRIVLKTLRSIVRADAPPEVEEVLGRKSGGGGAGW